MCVIVDVDLDHIVADRFVALFVVDFVRLGLLALDVPDHSVHS